MLRKLEKVFNYEAKKGLNDPETFLAAKDGEITDEILQAGFGDYNGAIKRKTEIR